MKIQAATPYAASYLVIRRDGKIAFVLRTNTEYMDGKYGLPAGKVEEGETFAEAAVREGMEEAGISIKPENLRFVHAMHRREGTTWIDIYFEPTEFEGEPYNAEPDIHGELAWLDPNSFPENIVPSIRLALEKIAEGQLYSEYNWQA